jgi:hypothetical protein
MKSGDHCVPKKRLKGGTTNYIEKEEAVVPSDTSKKGTIAGREMINRGFSPDHKTR